MYAFIGVLALQEALGGGGETAGGREAIRRIAGGPPGTILLVLTALGLAGYVAWRFVQAALDPEHPGGLDWKRAGMRLFYVASGVLYGVLALYALQLVLGSGAGSGGGSRSWTGELMRMSWGRWLVAAVGVGIGIRGLVQFVKAYTASFEDRIRSFHPGRTRRRWALAASRVGLTARGFIFLIIGSTLAFAALRHDPSRAGGLEQALGSLADTPWLLGLMGAGLVCYAIYQWTKALYRMIGA